MQSSRSASVPDADLTWVSLAWVSVAMPGAAWLASVAIMVDPDAPQWPYQQVTAILRERIKRGELGPRLPSHTTLADELDVSPMTVQRALKVLKDEGVIFSRPGRGTFVAER